VSEERNFEEEALEQGWNPDFDGPNKTDAKTFVERGEKIAGILKSRLDKQEQKIEHLMESNKQFGEYHKQTLEQQKKQTAQTITELEQKLEQSITDGDGTEYTRVNREINELKTEQPVDSSLDAWNRLSTQWVQENPWYNSDRKLGRFADGISEEIVAEGYQGQAYFSELTKRVQEEFPKDFKNPNKERANATEEGGNKSTGNSKAKSYDSLPKDAKAACDDFVSQGFMTKEDYVSQFEFED
jgi:hypothetical protein